MNEHQLIADILDYTRNNMGTSDIYDTDGNTLMTIKCSGNNFGAVLICKHSRNHYNVNELSRDIQIHIISHFMKYKSDSISMLQSSISDMNVILEEIHNHVDAL